MATTAVDFGNPDSGQARTDSAGGSRRLFSSLTAVPANDTTGVDIGTDLADLLSQLWSLWATSEGPDASMSGYCANAVSEEETARTASDFVKERALDSLLSAVSAAADQSFGDGTFEVTLSLDHDPVLGGDYLAVEILVSGRDRARYRAERRAFEEHLSAVLAHQDMKHVVLAPRLNA